MFERAYTNNGKTINVTVFTVEKKTTVKYFFEMLIFREILCSVCKVATFYLLKSNIIISILSINVNLRYTSSDLPHYIYEYMVEI